MNEEQFTKTLSKYLKYLTKEAKEEELKKYHNLDNYNIDPVIIANEIYKKRGFKYQVSKNINFLEALSIIINKIKSKNASSLIPFLIYLLVLIIVIKMPFLFVRDIVSSIFNNFFVNNTAIIIWNLLIEILYAITTIITFIKLIKNKALDIEKDA